MSVFHQKKQSLPFVPPDEKSVSTAVGFIDKGRWFFCAVAGRLVYSRICVKDRSGNPFAVVLSVVEGSKRL